MKTDAAQPLSRTIRRWLASALLRWQAALEGVVAEQPAALAPAEVTTTELYQGLAALQPVLKRKPVRRLRQGLGTLDELLRQAADWLSLRESIMTYQPKQRAASAEGLQPLADAAAQSAQQTFGMAVAWLRGPDAVELAEGLMDVVGALPMRRRRDVPLGQASAEQLRAAAEHLAELQAAFSAHEPKSLRRAQRAAIRCRIWVEAVGAAAPPEPAAAALAADLQVLVQRLDDLRRFAWADEAIGNFLDRWAVRQARRKAPQLHGAEAVLAFRQAGRALRRQQQRTLARAWQPVRGRRLMRRVTHLLRAAGAPARSKAKPQ